MPTVDGEECQLGEWYAHVQYVAYDPMVPRYDGGIRAIAHAARGQLFRTLMEECPSDFLDVVFVQGQGTGSRTTVQLDVKLIRVMEDDPHAEETTTTADEIRRAVEATGDLLTLPVEQVEIELARLEPGPRELVHPRPDGDEGDDEEDADADADADADDLSKDEFTSRLERLHGWYRDPDTKPGGLEEVVTE